MGYMGFQWKIHDSDGRQLVKWWMIYGLLMGYNGIYQNIVYGK